jgi:hypothetical protein
MCLQGFLVVEAAPHPRILSNISYNISLCCQRNVLIAYTILVGNPKGKDHLEEIYIYGKFVILYCNIILHCMDLTLVNVAHRQQM